MVSFLNGASVRKRIARLGARPMRVRTQPSPSNRSRISFSAATAAGSLSRSRSMVGVSLVRIPVLLAFGQLRSQSSSVALQTPVVSCHFLSGGTLPITGIGVKPWSTMARRTSRIGCISQSFRQIVV